MNRNKDNAGDPFEPGDPLKTGNFDKFWFRVMLVMLILVVVILAWFLLFAKRHHGQSQTSMLSYAPVQT